MRSKKILSKPRVLVCMLLLGFLLASTNGFSSDLVIEQLSEGNSVALGTLDPDREYSIAVRQAGQLNHLDLNVESDLFGRISQDGTEGLIELNTSGEFQTLLINQSGEFNESNIGLHGAENLANVEQSGVQNTLRYTVEGVLNIAELTQSGRNNTLILSQAGSDNKATLEQSGSNNLIDVVQNGGGLIINIVQQGNDEAIVIR